VRNPRRALGVKLVAFRERRSHVEAVDRCLHPGADQGRRFTSARRACKLRLHVGRGGGAGMWNCLAWLGGDVSGRDAHNMHVTLSAANYAKPQLGEYDNQILCGSCDNQLGAFDNYALQICKAFKSDYKTMPHGTFELESVDGDKLAKFVLAVLWRASISSRPDYAAVSLGPYEDRARDVLFGAQPLGGFKQFQVMVQRYMSNHFDTERFYSLPVRAPFGNFNSYGFSLAGCRPL
jgi:hypothetical protein